MNRLLKAGDRVRLEGAAAEVVEEQGGRATVVRPRLESVEQSAEGGAAGPPADTD